MKDKIYILFDEKGIKRLIRKTKNIKSLSPETYMAELNLEVDNSFFNNQIPKFNIKLEEKNISNPKIEIGEQKESSLALFFSENKKL